MNKELYNGSGCKDPTPYQAIKNAEKRYYPLVYICSPFSGDVENNIIKAQKYSRYALDEGNISHRTTSFHFLILSVMKVREDLPCILIMSFLENVKKYGSLVTR